MKLIKTKITKNFFAFTLILTVWGCMHVQPAYTQFVKPVGTSLVDEKGEPLFIAGVNLGNWLLWEGYMMVGEYTFMTHSQTLEGFKKAFGGDAAKASEFEHQWRMNYVTEQTISDIKDLGFNSVRVPFHYNMFWNGSNVTDLGFPYFDNLISWCKKYNVYILLDMHAAPGYQNPGDHSDNPHGRGEGERESVKFWDGNNVEIAAKIWKHIAGKYKDEPIIWAYDLLNEPVPQAGREYEMLQAFVTIKNAVREVDPNHIIMTEGAWWGADLSYLDWTDAKVQLRTGVKAKWDDKLVYQTHHYSDDVSLLNERKAITDKLNIPLVLGEYGENNDGILREMTDWCINNNVGYYPWTFKKMYFDKTLWTIAPNNAYKNVRNYIMNSSGNPPANAYDNMIAFCKNNLSNDKASFSTGFYNAVRMNSEKKKFVFNLDMTRAIDSGVFNPNSDVVKIIGFNDGWSGGRNLTRTGETTNYTVTISEEIDPGTQNYKFKIGDGWDKLECKFYEKAAGDTGEPFNRKLTIDASKVYTVDCIWEETYFNSIAEVNAIDQITIEPGILFESIAELPLTVNIQLGIPGSSSGETANIPVTWKKGSYDENAFPGQTFTVMGEFDLIDTFYNYFNVLPQLNLQIKPLTSLSNVRKNYNIYYDSSTRQIVVSGEEPVRSVDILSVTGCKLLSFSGTDRSFRINMHDLPSGVYLIAVNNAEILKILL